MRDRGHVRYVATQPCLVCGRSPSDAHHLRFAQSRALGRKVSDEFVVPLCRGHHRAVHRHGDEVAWWQNASIDPSTAARSLWLETHQTQRIYEKAELKGLMPEDAKEAIGHGIRAKRSKSGAVSFDLLSVEGSRA